MQRVNIEHCADTATVWPSYALNADVEFAAICWVGVAGIVSRLVGLSRVGTNEAVAHLRLVATVNVIGPDANTVLIIIGQAGGTLVLGGLAVPARVEDATI